MLPFFTGWAGYFAAPDLRLRFEGYISLRKKNQNIVPTTPATRRKVARISPSIFMALRSH